MNTANKITIRFEHEAAPEAWRAIAVLGGAVVATSTSGTKAGARADVKAQLEEMGLLTDGVNARMGY